MFNLGPTATAEFEEQRQGVVVQMRASSGRAESSAPSCSRAQAPSPCCRCGLVRRRPS